jgi:hypothetical protein
MIFWLESFKNPSLYILWFFLPATFLFYAVLIGYDIHCSCRNVVHLFLLGATTPILQAANKVACSRYCLATRGWFEFRLA